MTGAARLDRIRLVAARPERLAEFYQQAFGFVRSAPAPADLAKLMGMPGATAQSLMLRLGGQKIELLGIHPFGSDFPLVPGWSPLFQHCAIVVSDMAAAYARLGAQAGWTAISQGGPQVLPPASGGVTAFKFRDPENHPLELLAFAPGAVPAPWQQAPTLAGEALGIDHSAISVADTARSTAFYAGLGLSRIGGSLNIGAAQERLDDVANVRVEVTALAPAVRRTPHVELLCYRGAYDRSGPAARANDAAATALVFSMETRGALQSIVAQNEQACLDGPVLCEDGVSRALLRDPDGHFICIEGA